jgi:proteasome lid subunit RPN8/RPN11
VIDELIVPRAQFDEMLAHLHGDLTQERCGLMAGEGNRVTRVLPVPNALRSRVAYRMGGQEFVDALIACNWEPLAIYHSHPEGPAAPSPTDIAQATVPEAFYVIASFQTEPPEVRAFRIRAGQVVGVALVVAA